jgi:hypothetical protein
MNLARSQTSRGGHAGPSRKLTGAEIRPLAIQARKAFEFQRALGNLDHGDTFDAWRHREVFALCAKPGLSALSAADWRPAMARFCLLSGMDERAIDLLIRSGKARDHSAPADTREAREEAAALIRAALAAHAEWGDSTGTPPASRIGFGYLLAVARNKTGNTHLRDWPDLLDRLTAGQLRQLLFTLRNRISTREGRADPLRRAPRKSLLSAADLPPPRTRWP